MKILAIDPGDTIGIALYQFSSVSGLTIKTYADIKELFVTFQPDVVVVENFFIRRGKPSNYHSALKQIGVIEYLCQQYSSTCVLQSPAVLKTMMRHVPTDIKISHIRSAVAHLLYYLLKNDIEDSEWKDELKVGGMQ